MSLLGVQQSMGVFWPLPASSASERALLLGVPGTEVPPARLMLSFFMSLAMACTRRRVSEYH